MAPPASERRDKSADSPAKYAGNEDGEKSDDEHRGEIRWSGTMLVIARDKEMRILTQHLLIGNFFSSLRSKAIMVRSQEPQSIPDP